MDEKYLTPDDIVGTTPRGLVALFIKGIMAEHGLSVSVVLDKDENNTEMSRGTGKVFITDPSSQAAYCTLLRTWPDKAVSQRCNECDRRHFEDTKIRAQRDPSYRGEIYQCSAGGLYDFVVPIVEKESNTFIGTIFGGQKRPKESYFETWKRLRNFTQQRNNHCLTSIPFWRLYWNYLRVEAVTEKELRGMKSMCETISNELARPFEFLVRMKRAQREGELEQKVVARIDDLVIKARSMKTLCDSMDTILAELQEWLAFDWGLLLLGTKATDDEIVFAVKGVVGRGIGPLDLVRSKQLICHADEWNQSSNARHNSSLFTREIHAMVHGQPDQWWFPVTLGEGDAFGGIVLGSAPEHRKTQYDSQRIEKQTKRLEEIAAKIGVKYSVLSALENVRQKTKELEQSKEQLASTINTLENTLLGLTHQVERPLVMVQAALSLARDLHGSAWSTEIIDQMELGILAAKYAALLNRGIKKVFAATMIAETGHRRDQIGYKRERINVKSKLDELTKAMHRLSGRKDVSFRYFDASPEIEMDTDSFLYVFYALVDNAIKYSYANRTIELVCDEERQTGKYAIKVKSFGDPIENPNTVFQKFKRGANASRVDDTGIGLGCWSAREHMLGQGGDITLETSGNLSIFVVHLPS